MSESNPYWGKQDGGLQGSSTRIGLTCAPNRTGSLPGGRAQQVAPLQENDFGHGGLAKFSMVVDWDRGYTKALESLRIYWPRRR